MATWTSPTPPQPVRIGPPGWALVGLRAAFLIPWVFGGLALHAGLRVAEHPLHGELRPWTPWITVMVCRGALWIMGIPLTVTGHGLQGPGAMVANHVSWTDIFALNAAGPIFFVSKDEVAGWPGIGLLARSTGTVFIRRDRREAARHTAAITDRLRAGHRLLVFPEGTSTDGRRVLPFKSTIFAAFLNADVKAALHVQPVTLIYTPPEGADPRFYGWWGGMGFLPHLTKLLATARQGRIEVRRHAPIPMAEASDRKALARQAEATIRRSLESAEGAGP